LRYKSPVLWFFILVIVIVGVTAFGPPEQSLGSNVRVVYLHGAWVWTALIGILAAGVSGALALVTRNEALHRWSSALGRTGMFFWLTYLPLSLWAMQTNWNGLFLAEPRWRVAIVFALGGLALQIVLSLVKDSNLSSLGNLLYAAGLMYALSRTDQIMHPSSPILESDALRIQVFFGGLTLLALLAAWQMTRWWIQLERS
jgi:hypothetical protein